MSCTSFKPSHQNNAIDRAQIVLDVTHVQQLERMIAQAGTSLETLMYKAGNALAHQAINHYTTQKENLPVEKPYTVIFCGNGNNGGDGWVAGLKLVEQGWHSTIICAKDISDISAQPAHDVESVCAPHIPTILVNPSHEVIQHELKQADIIIDALLGTGFEGKEIKEPFCSWVTTINQCRTCQPKPYIISADVPSGMNAQTGGVSQPCVKADATITMIVNKPGLVTPYAFAYCGEVHVAPLCPIEPFMDTFKAPQKPQASPKMTSSAPQHDAFHRAENEDDDGYDPYSDRLPQKEPLFNADPWK